MPSPKHWIAGVPEGAKGLEEPKVAYWFYIPKYFGKPRLGTVSRNCIWLQGRSSPIQVEIIDRVWYYPDPVDIPELPPTAPPLPKRYEDEG